VDWIDQALLRLHARERIEHFQNAGLRTATDFLDAYYPPDLSGEALLKHRENIASLLDSYLGKEGASKVQHGHTLTLMEMMAAALGLDPNKLHIRHWRDHEYEALPEDIERDRLAAHIKLMRDFPDEAIAAYDDLLKRYPDYHSARLYRGLAYFALKENSRAVDDYTAAIQLGGPKWENGRYAYMERGRALRALGQYTEAVDNYREAIETYKSFPEARFDMAYVQTTYLHQYDEAIDHLRLVINSKFREAEALATLGLARYERWKQKGKPEDTQAVELGDARADLERARRLQPDSMVPYLNLAYLDEELGRTTDAIRTLTDALRLDIQSDPDNAYRAYLRRGNLYLKRKDFQPAIADYRSAIKVIPDNVAAFYNLGTALRRAGDAESALLAFRDAVRVDPLHADAREALGDMAVALRTINLLGEAEAAYENALRLAREAGNQEAEARGHLNLGRLYVIWDNHHDDAERELRQAAKLALHLPGADVLLLGTWFSNNEDPDTAIGLFKMSAECFEQSGEVRPSIQANFQLGLAYAAKGDSASARDAWGKAREQLEAIFDPQNQDDRDFVEAIDKQLA
jgi:tetratricopeptide (TPR) repeat protein